MHRVALALIALFAVPAAAQAAAWTPGADLGQGAGAVADPVLEFPRAGSPLLGYRYSGGDPFPAPAYPDWTAVAALGSNGSPVRDVAPGSHVAVAGCGSRCVVVLRRQGKLRKTLVTQTGRSVSALGRARALVRYYAPEDYDEGITGSSRPQLAAHPDGAVAIAWIEAATRSRDGSVRGGHLRVVLRARAGSFGRPRTVAFQRTGTVRAARLTFHRRDAVTVAYVRQAHRGGRTQRTVEARVIPLRGRMRAVQELGAAPEVATDLSAVSSPRGRTVVAWGNHHGTVMGAESRRTVHAAMREPRRTSFRRVQVLDPGAVVQVGAPGAVSAGIADDGTATVGWAAWTSRFGQQAEVRVATAAPGSRFGPAEALATGGTYYFEDVAVAGNGAVLAVWTAYTAPAPEITGAVRAARGSFTAPEPIAVLDTRQFNPVSPQPDAAFDPGGRFAVVWSADRSAGTPPMHAPGSAHLRLAFRALPEDAR